MIKPVKVGATVEYISRLDKGKEKTVWLLRVVPLGWRTEVWNNTSKLVTAAGAFKTNYVPSANELIQIVKMGLDGWRNFKDEDGKEITPEYEPDKKYGLRVLTDESLGLIPWPVLSELAGEIMRLNFLQEPEKKG